MAIKSFLSEGGFSVGSVGSTPIDVIDSSGNITASTLTLSGNLIVNGTTVTLNSTTTTLDDPIITLGGDTAPTVNDSKDRGVEFRWHNGTVAKVGFFGYDTSTGYLTFIPDAANASEQFSGTQGDIQAANFRGNLIGNVTGNVSGSAGSAGSVATLTAGSYLTGGSFNGSAAVTFAVDATSANTASKVVARDGSGNFSAGTISAIAASGYLPVQLALINNGSGTVGSVRFTSQPDGAGGYITFNGTVTANTSGTVVSGSSTITSDHSSRKTGLFQFVGGTGGTAGFQFFTSDAGANQILTERLRIQHDGNIGIGTASPSYKLDVAGGIKIGGEETLPSAIGSMYLSYNSAINRIYYGDGTGYDLRFSKRGASTTTDFITFKDTGNVGIGTTDPIQKLDVRGYVVSNVSSTAGGFYLGNSGYGIRRSSSDVYVYASSGTLYLGADGSSTQQVTVSSTGNVGIGTASPGAKLEVSTGATTNSTAVLIGPSSGIATLGDKIVLGFKLQNTAGGGTGNTYAAGIAGLQDSSGTNTGALGFYTQASAGDGTPERMRISNTGNVGIGTTAPLTALQVGSVSGGNIRVDSNGVARSYWGSEATPRWELGRDTLTSGGHLIFSLAGGSQQTLGSGIGIPANNAIALYTSNGSALTERLRVDNLGNVGIGTTTPYSTLTVGSNDSTAVITPGGNNTHLTLKTVGASGAIRFYATGGTTSNVAATESMRVDAGGNVGIGTTTPTNGQLEVAGNSDSASAPNRPRIALTNNAGTAVTWTIQPWSTSGDANLSIYRSGSTGNILLAPTGGNVGIGTTSPGARFEVRKTDGGNAFRFANYVDGGALGSWVGTYGAEFRTVTSGSVSHGMLINNNEANDSRRTLDISDSNGVFATFTNGKVGIGTTSPNHKLSVVGQIGGGTFSMTYADFRAGTADISGNDGVRLMNNGSTVLTVSSTGNVGIGTTSPTAALHVSKAVNADWVAKFVNTGTNPYGLYVDTSANAGSEYTFAAYTNAGTGLLLRNNGNLGVGTATPLGILHVSSATGLTASWISNTAEGVDAKNWAWQMGSAVGSNILRLRAVNDANTTGNNAVEITRSGTTISQVAFPSTTGTVSIASTTAGASNVGALVVAGGISAGQSAQASWFGGNLTVAGGSIVNGSSTSVLYFGTPSANYLFYDGTTLVTRLGGADRLTINASTGAATFSGAVSAPSLTLSTTPLAFASGGTGATTAGSALAKLTPIATTVTSATPVTLTNTSANYQIFTGSTTQTILLPVTSTLETGWTFSICNNSTAVLTIQTSAGTFLIFGPFGCTIMCKCIATGSTAVTDWEVSITEFSTNSGTGAVVLNINPTFSAFNNTGAAAMPGAAASVHTLGTNLTTGTATIGGTATTGTLTFGQSTAGNTINIDAGLTASGATKTLNIGTGGLAGSTTAITIGSATGTSTTEIKGNLNISTGPATFAGDLSLVGNEKYLTLNSDNTVGSNGRARFRAVGSGGGSGYGGSFVLDTRTPTNNYVTALSIDSSQAATFAGAVTSTQFQSNVYRQQNGNRALLSFDGTAETSLGSGSPGDTTKINANGVQALRIDASLLATFAGAVTVSGGSTLIQSGTADPFLHLKTTADTYNPYIRFEGYNRNYYMGARDDGADATFVISPASALTTPFLSIAAATSAATFAGAVTSSSYIRTTGTYGFQIGELSGHQRIIYGNIADTFQFLTAANGSASLSAGAATFAGAVTIGGSANLSVQSGAGLFLDGGGNTYIVENAADSVQVKAGGLTALTTTSALTTVNGNLTVSGTGTSTFAGAVTTGALTVSSANLILSAGYELRFGSAADRIYQSSSSGGTLVLDAGNVTRLTLNSTAATFAGAVTIGGNLTVNGTTTTVNSTTVTVDDPIITLGGDTTPTVDDNKDRGVEFKWHNGTIAKNGFFGFDDSTGYLTFIPDATNTSEVFSGTLGDIQATNFRGNLIGNVSATTLTQGGTVGHITKEYTFNLSAQSNTQFFPIRLSGSPMAGAIHTVEVLMDSFGGGDPYNHHSVLGKVRGSGWTDLPAFYDVFHNCYDNSERSYLGFFKGTQSCTDVILYVRGGKTYYVKTPSTASVSTTALTVNDSVFAIKDSAATDVSGSSANISFMLNLITSAQGRHISHSLGVAGAATFTGAVSASNLSGTNTGDQTVGNGVLTLGASGTGLSGTASFSANQSGATTFTVVSNATSANTASTIVARDGSGNFSAGTITGTRLEARNSGSTQIYLDSTTSGSKEIVFQNNGVVAGYVWASGGYVGVGSGAATTSLFVTTASGNVGIGTTSPSYKFQVESALAANATFTTNSNMLAMFKNTTSAVSAWGGIKLQADEGSGIWFSDESGTSMHGYISTRYTGQMDFATGQDSATAATVKMSILTSGNVGIGTTSPISKLQIAGTSGSLLTVGTLTNNWAGDVAIGISNANGIIVSKINTSNDTNRVLVFYRDDTNGATIWGYTPSGGSGNVGFQIRANASSYFNGGNVGIGTTTPGYKLDVQGSVSAGISGGVNNSQFRVLDGAIITKLQSQTSGDTAGVVGTESNNVFKIVTNNSARMTIDTAGNVGIGTITPGYKLEVNGSFAATTKSFVIKHPTKEGKKLRYGSLEGPENGVYIRGKTTSKVIELPDYWTKLVDPDSISVQLTSIGSHQKLYVEKIENNKVYISNENLLAKNINCFFYILAERADVEKLQVEVDA